jgi:hypothetical protein
LFKLTNAYGTAAGGNPKYFKPGVFDLHVYLHKFGSFIAKNLCRFNRIKVVASENFSMLLANLSKSYIIHNDGLVYKSFPLLYQSY